MKKLLNVLIAIVVVIACNTKKATQAEDKRIALRTDTTNVVKLSDTLVIFESTCRGCAYEGSTHFDISDSLGIIKLAAIKTTDNNSPDMNGGSVSKTLVLVPVKIGTTTIKMYKFWADEETAKDSANFTSYTIEVRN